MHKIFAKTLFLGKSVVYLPHCHSTNDVARALDKSDKLKEGTVVMTDYQEKGKGQQGNVWASEDGKNLLFTLILKPAGWSAARQFYLNALVSLSLLRTVRAYLSGAKVEIKWPNDIYVNDRKIAGILIETTIKGATLESAFCGIGLNVNQTHFTIPTATSFSIESGETFDREDILQKFLMTIEHEYPLVEAKLGALYAHYQQHLRWRNETRHFQIDNQEKRGIIQGVDEAGRLVLLTEEGLQTFGMKEVQFLY